MKSAGRISVDSAESLEAVYHQQIPISAHMGIQVKSWQDDKLTLTAPLADNINHQQSAFGGSLFSLAALAGWGILQLKLTEASLDCNTVIAGGDVEYFLPVFEDFTCECALPHTWAGVEAKIKDKGKATLTLTSTIRTGNERAMAFTGRYVIHNKGTR